LNCASLNGVVVGHVRAAVAAGDAEVDQQLRDRLGRHGGAAVFVDAGWRAVVDGHPGWRRGVIHGEDVRSSSMVLAISASSRAATVHPTT